MISCLDATVGRERYLMAVSSDHGVSPLPEVAKAQGHDAGRVDAVKEVVALEFFLSGKFHYTGKWIANIPSSG